jgi:hypothetical protein
MVPYASKYQQRRPKRKRARKDRACRPWVKDSPFTGKDDCAWHLFDLPRPDERAVTHFIGRTDSMRRAA